MNNAYPYALVGWTKGRNKSLLCPGCGNRSCYKEYFYTDTNQPVDPDGHLVGKCDHEWCGYHVTPKEFFCSNPEQRRTDIKVMKQPAKKRIEIDRKVVAQTMRAYDHNVFVNWLINLPWDEDTRSALHHIIFMYAIGTSKKGGTIWWQVDEAGIVRTGKIMQYKADGHRDKSHFGTWVHSEMRKQGAFPEEEYDLVQCLFGLHLIGGAEADAVVHIVESEKTAVLMACFDDNFGHNIWMACGGLQNLREPLLAPLKGHKVLVYPDTNGVEKWQRQIEGMPNVELATAWMQKVTDEDPAGCDIADVCLRLMMKQPREKLEAMRKQYPAIDILINKLALELQ